MQIARHWRMNHQRYRLQGTMCTTCGKLSFSPRAVCDACQNVRVVAYSTRYEDACLWQDSPTLFIKATA